MKRISIRLAAINLSMVLVAVTVKAQDKLPSSPDKAESKGATRSDSIKDGKDDVTRLIQVLMESGDDQKIGPNIAPIVGLSHAMATKAGLIRISADGETKENRQCHVTYEITGDKTSDGKRPAHIFLTRGKRFPGGNESRYFKVALDGRLEKVIATSGKRDENGKPIPDSLKSVDEDINSPEVKEAFNAEMAIWTGDWLKKKQAAVSKKSASAKPTKADSE